MVWDNRWCVCVFGNFVVLFLVLYLSDNWLIFRLLNVESGCRYKLEIVMLIYILIVRCLSKESCNILFFGLNLFNSFFVVIGRYVECFFVSWDLLGVVWFNCFFIFLCLVDVYIYVFMYLDVWCFCKMSRIVCLFIFFNVWFCVGFGY